MRDVLIAQGDSQKGRQFRAVCLATIEADSLWDGGETAGDKIRPVWAAFAGSDGELRPFVANMRSVVDGFSSPPTSAPTDESAASKWSSSDPLSMTSSGSGPPRARS